MTKKDPMLELSYRETAAAITYYNANRATVATVRPGHPLVAFINDGIRANGGSLQNIDTGEYLIGTVDQLDI